VVQQFGGRESRSHRQNQRKNEECPDFVVSQSCGRKTSQGWRT
jgi:hypothetical protein